MKANKHVFHASHFSLTPAIDRQVQALPFYVKEIGFLNDRRMVRGSRNDYSDYLFLYSLSQMSFIKYRKKSAIRQDDVVISACNTPLTFVQLRKHDYLYVIISGNSAQFYYNHIRNNSGIFHANPLSGILDLFLELLSIDYKKEPLISQMEAGCAAQQLLLELYRMSRSVIETREMTPVQDTAIQTAVRFIQENYQQDLTIDAVCNSVSFSKYYFCKLFKQHTGKTVHQYVNEYRVNKSKELLSYSKLSIAAVANTVGFKNTLTFSRQFKEYMHMTPTEYREYY